MSRVFVGVGYEDGGSGVCVEQNGERQRLTRRVNRVHQGYSWDQAGPRSTELARVILWIVTGTEPPFALYRGFAIDVVAHMPVPVCEGECWRLTEADIRAWLHDAGWANMDNPSEYAAQMKVSRQARRVWDGRARSAMSLFRRRTAA